MQMGYHCCHFYNLDSGVPVFMLGEDLWLKTSQDLTAILSNPNGGTAASKNLFAGSAIQIYQFQKSDPIGSWTLKAQYGEASKQITLHVLSDQLNGSVRSLSYQLRSSRLLITGGLTIQSQQPGGGILVLAHKDKNSSLTSQPSPFIEGDLRQKISWESTNPRLITITLMALSLNKSYTGRAWAEVSAETSLTKQIGNGEVLVTLRQLIMRSHSSSMNFTGPSLQLQLPDLHSVGLDGQAPLRPGLNRLTTFVEIGTTIYSVTLDMVIARTGILTSIASSTPIMPIQTDSNFELADELNSISEYELVLIARTFGANSVWEMPIIPPVTRIHLINKFTQTPITEFEIDSTRMRAHTHVGDYEYAIPDTNQPVDLTVSVGGIALSQSEFSPQSVTMAPLSKVDIFTSVGNLNLRVADQFGNSPPSGTIRIARIMGSTSSSPVEKSWTSSNEDIVLTLPLGEYSIDLNVQGATVTQLISLQSSTKQLDISLPGLIIDKSRNELLMIAFVILLILAELLVLVRISGRIRRRKK